MELKTGLTASSVEQVTENKCAVNVGSGDLMVYATPSMAALMENAAMKAVSEALPEGSTTVGSLISTSHMKPTPVGATVTAKAELVQVEGRKLVFKIFAEDQNGPIGEGEHVRFVVDRERFMAKLK
ncbi:MAG: thioesterase family protein [Tidjanibacter sp.]|nr:thioesterase family protein [Tidjanibacter sp.]